MSGILKSGRFAVLLLVGLFLAACSQTSAVSTYSGSLGSSVSKERKAQIKRSRERAKEARAKRTKEFKQKREAARKARADRRAKRRGGTTKKVASKTTRTKKPKKISSRSLSKKKKAVSKRRVAAKKSNRKRARKYSKRSKKTAKVTSRKGSSKKKVAKKSKKSVKRTKHAFVGGSSKGIAINAPWKCVPKRLKIVVDQVSRKFGKVRVNSTHRSRAHNRRVGGKSRSYHLRCQAVDFSLYGSKRGLYKFLRNHPFVGGFKVYPGGHIHIDTGPRRTW